MPSGPPTSVTNDTVTANSITLHWEEVTCLDRNGNITDYLVRVTRGGQQIQLLRVTADAEEVTISGLTLLTEYVIQVAAVNGAGTGPYSDDTHVETAGECVCVYHPVFITAFSFPDKLTLFAISSTNTSITLLWVLDNSLTAAVYTIYYFSTEDKLCFSDCKTIPDIPGSETVKTLTGLEEGTEYSLTVAATFARGEVVFDTTTATTMPASQSLLYGGLSSVSLYLLQLHLLLPLLWL